MEPIIKLMRFAMRYLSIIKIILPAIILQLLLTGCYTQFGLAHQDERYETVEYYEDDYNGESDPVIVHHHYIPRPRSIYFYYDPHEFWYYEPGVYVSVHHYRSYWRSHYYPDYIYYPHPHWHHPPTWRYPVPYIVYVPGYQKPSPHFGRRPGSIAGRKQRSGSSNQDAFFGGSKRPDRRSYANISADKKRSQRRTTSVTRRSSGNTTDRKVTGRKNNRGRDQNTIAKPKSSSSRRRVASQTRNSGSSSQKSTKVRSSGRKNRSSGKSASKTRVSGNRASSGNKGSFSKPRSSSRSSGSSSRSGKSSSRSSGSSSKRRR